MFDDAHEVRLFSVSGIKGEREAEQRATAALLSTLTIARPLSQRLLGALGASKADKAKVQAWTEVSFDLPDGETLRPDGVIRVTSGRHMFTALVETKIGDRRQELDQISSYLRLASLEGFDYLITISPEIAPFAGAHPTVGADALAAHSKIGLQHLSWAKIHAEAVKEHAHRGVEDFEQAWLVAELIRYLEHQASGTIQSNDMGDNWTTVRDQARDGLLTKATDETMGICRRWDQLLHLFAMRLGSELGIDVREVVPQAHRRDPAKRDRATASSLCSDGTLSGRLRVPGAAADLQVIADLRASRVIISSEVEAPSDKGSKGRIGWLLRQLRAAPGEATVEAFIRGGKAPEICTLNELRHDQKLLLRTKDKPPVRFRVSQRSEMGQGRRTVRKLGFSDSVAEAVDRFYGEVLQHIKSASPIAPQMAVAQGEATNGPVPPTSVQTEPSDEDEVADQSEPASQLAAGIVAWPWETESADDM